MARYGQNSEDLRREAEELRRVRAERAKADAAAQELGASEESLAERYERGTARRRLYSRAKEEGATASEEAAAANRREIAAIDQDTAAIQRNAAARERARVATRGTGRAFAGARDPLFAQAAGMADPTTGVSQYQLRRQLQIGQSRAKALQEAIGLGIQPGTVGADRPQTRATAAQQGMAEADAAYAQARRTYTSTINRASATEQERLAAFRGRETAQAQQRAAKLELESAQREATARDANAQAIARERAMRERASGGALIRHPTEFGQPFYGEAQATQRYASRPGARAEIGAVGGAFGAGRPGYDAAVLKRQADAAKAAAAAQTQLAASQTAEERAYRLGVHERAVQLLGQEAGATDRVRDATRFNAVELGTASQQMRRHGALTSEFIQAAARGETTMREMGNQALITIGKFGAWTTAAAAVYGVVGAVHQLGEGAIQSSSGVNQLRRVVNDVNPQTAQQNFRDLAGQFNVPVEQASDAVYRMGQVFHGQADAVEAAKAALYSYKTGEVDVATSTTNLISIVRGFGLSSQDLLSVYDQINQAQNTFGIKIGDTEAGLAKAAGTYRNAGGDLNYLLALFVAIQKATGRSGQEIGTGIARAVNQIRRPTNQEMLRQQGVTVDPDNLQKTFQSALNVARKGHADLQQVAAGLFGNQYARLIAPVLKDQTTLNQALEQTSPEASKNSAQKELAKTLGQVDEQIHKVGISLQRLGSGLAQAGVFDFAGVLLHTLNGTLDIANELVDVFDKIPEPLRTALAVAGELALMMKVVGRFGGGDALATRYPQLAFLAKPDDRLKARAVRGARDQEQYAYDFREQTAKSAFTASARAEAARGAATDFSTHYRTLEARGALGAADSEQRLAMNKELIRLNTEAEAAERTALAAQREANLAKRLSVTAEQERAALEKMDAAAVRAHLAASATPFPADFGVPSTRGAQYIGPGARGGEGHPFTSPTGGLGAGAYLGGGPVVPQVARDIDNAIQRQRGFVGGVNQLRTRVQEWGREQGRLSVASRAAATGASAALGATSASVGALRAAGTGLRSLPTQLRALWSSLGIFDIALLGVIGAVEVGDILKSHFEKVGKQADLLGSQATSLEDYTRQYQTARDKVRGGGGPGILNDYNYTAATRDLDTARRIRQTQEQARRRGQPIPEQFYGTVTAAMQRDARLRQDGLISLAEFDKRMKNHAVELHHLQNGNAQYIQQGLAAIATLRRAGADPNNLEARLAGAGVKELQLAMQATAGALGTASGGGRGRVRELQAEYTHLIPQLQGDDWASQQSYFQTLSTYYKALEDNANNNLQVALLGARTDQDRNRAYGAARQALSRIPDAAKALLDKDRRGLRDAQDSVERDRAALRAGGGAAGALRGLLPGTADIVPDLKARLKSDVAKLRQFQGKVDKDSAGYRDALAQKEQDLLKLRQQRSQALVAQVQSENAVAQARAGTTQDPVAIARAAATSARRVLDTLRHTGGDPDAVRNALAEYINAQNSVTQAVQQQGRTYAQLESQLAQARHANDPAAQANDARAFARYEIAHAKNREERLQGLIDLANANNQAEQAALASEQARFSYLESLTDDPVKQAQLELQSARASLKGKRGADRYNAMADINNKQRALLQARIQSGEDQIDFDVQMGKITADQAADQLEQLLHNHHLSQRMRRDLQLKIKQYRDQAQQEAQGFDLAIGDLKLPTIYDVRRALAPIRQGAAGNNRTVVNAQVNVTVEDPSAASKVYDAIDNTLSTSVQATMRNAGMI